MSFFSDILLIFVEELDPARLALRVDSRSLKLLLMQEPIQGMWAIDSFANFCTFPVLVIGFNGHSGEICGEL